MVKIVKATRNANLGLTIEYKSTPLTDRPQNWLIV